METLVAAHPSFTIENQGPNSKLTDFLMGNSNLSWTTPKVRQHRVEAKLCFVINKATTTRAMVPESTKTHPRLLQDLHWLVSEFSLWHSGCMGILTINILCCSRSPCKMTHSSIFIVYTNPSLLYQKIPTVYTQWTSSQIFAVSNIQVIQVNCIQEIIKWTSKRSQRISCLSVNLGSLLSQLAVSTWRTKQVRQKHKTVDGEEIHSNKNAAKSNKNDLYSFLSTSWF